MRKRRIVYVIFMILALWMFTACGKGTTFVESSVPEGSVSEEPSADAPSESESEPGTESKSSTPTRRPPEKPHQQTTAAPTESEEETVFEYPSYPYYVDELDIDLAIPEKLYVYRINSVCYDWTAGVHVHDYSEWIVLTDQEYADEAALEQQLADHYEEEAGHIVWILAITPAELRQVVAFSVFDNNRTKRITSDGQYICAFLNAALYYVRSPESQSPEYQPMSYDSFAGSQAAAALGNRYSAEKESLESVVREKTHPLPCLNEPGYSGLIISFNPTMNSRDKNGFRDSIADAGFWEVFCQTAEELKSSPEKYGYEEEGERISRLSEKWKNADPPYVGEGEKVKLEEICADAEQDIYIRAYLCARYKIGAELQRELGDEVTARRLESVSPKDFLVLLQKWDSGQQSFVAYKIEADGSETLDADQSGIIGDLTAAHEYMVNYEKTLAEEQ